jgi:zinc/manganese transport system permease protein
LRPVEIAWRVYVESAAAARRLTASPRKVTILAIIFAAVAAAEGGLLLSLQFAPIKASVFISLISFAIYLAARLIPLVSRRRLGRAAAR